jgi:hypothetical protein
VEETLARLLVYKYDEESASKEQNVVKGGVRLAKKLGRCNKEKETVGKRNVPSL